ncbi:DUF3293 domain-containing protein [Falsiroseomonas sp.]|uniref:DUF3293 domain-containing protein n=1 Tax=Falsiroseomonas sp. TaxID=2870721 RepID=UPI003F6EC561
MQPPLAAFRATGYEAAGITVRIGRRSAGLDALLAARGVRQAGFVTAWNPRSRRMPPGWNRRQQDRLRQAARSRVLAEGFGRAGAWAEHHLLLAGDPRRLAVLARRFRQWAIVVVAAGRPARLVRVLAAPPHSGPPNSGPRAG